MKPAPHSRPLTTRQCTERLSLDRIHRDTHRTAEGVLISYNQAFATDNLSRVASEMAIVGRLLEQHGYSVPTVCRTMNAIAAARGFRKGQDALDAIEARTTARWFHHSNFYHLSQVLFTFENPTL